MPVSAVELEVGNRTVRVTSPDKIYFPEVGLTKLDVVSYVVAVGDGIFSALKDRPVTMERWPGGYRPDVKLSTRSDSHGEAFYQKRAPSKGMPDWVETVTIAFPSGRTADEVCATELATIVWMANLGTLRYHPWPVTKADTEKVDQLRIDLDPQPGPDFSDAARAAHELRSGLDDAGLVGFPKTSGGRGVHVFVPIEPTYGFIEARHAVIALGRELSRRMPDHVTVNWWKEERGARIFVDFNQMARSLGALDLGRIGRCRARGLHGEFHARAICRGRRRVAILLRNDAAQHRWCARDVCARRAGTGHRQVRWCGNAVSAGLPQNAR